MPTFEITSPQGKTYEVTAPDGATREQAFEFFRSTKPELFVSEKKAPEPTTLQSLGRGAKNIAKGLTALPGMAYDAAALPFNAGIAGYNELTGNRGGYIRPAREQLFGTEPEGIQDRVQQEVAAAVPTMGAGLAMSGARSALPPIMRFVGQALATKPASQVVGATGSALAGGAAQQADLGPVAEIAASLAGGVGGAGLAQAGESTGRAVMAAAQPFTRSGRERMAADVLLRSSADPAGLNARVAQGQGDPMARLPGSPVTTAQAARDPGLMVLEQGLRSDAGRSGGQGGQSGAVAFRDIEARRNANRLAAMQRLEDQATPEARGAAVRGALDTSEREAARDTSARFQAIDPAGTTAVPLRPIGQGMFDAATRRFGPGSGGVPANVNEILDEVRQAPNRLTFEWFQNMRSRLGEAAGKANQAGDRRAASTFGDMERALERGVERAVQQGRGFTPDQARAWREAIAARREQGAAFGRDEGGSAVVGQVLKDDRYGRPMMLDATVAQRALSSPQALQQVRRAAGNRWDQVSRSLRGQFAENMLNASRTTGVTVDASGNAAQSLSPAGFARFFRENRRIAEQLFPQPWHRRALTQLENDFAETSMVTATARARGSDTAQNLSVGSLIARATNGLIEPNSPLAQTSVGLGGIMRLIYAAPEAATREILVEAASNPQFARTLLQRAGPDAVRRASGYLNSIGDRLRIAGYQALTRQTARTANATAADQE